jgi:hypothetical protein
MATNISNSINRNGFIKVLLVAYGTSEKARKPDLDSIQEKNVQLYHGTFLGETVMKLIPTLRKMELA